MKIFAAAVEDLYQLLWTGRFPAAPAHDIRGPMAKRDFTTMTLQDPGESTQDTGECLKKTQTNY